MQNCKKCSISRCWHWISQQSYESPDIYSEIELELIGVGLVKSLNQGLLPISLNLISNGIKEILTKKNTNIIRNIYPDLMIKMLSANKKKLFIIFLSRFRLYA